MESSVFTPNRQRRDSANLLDAKRRMDGRNQFSFKDNVEECDRVDSLLSCGVSRNCFGDTRLALFGGGGRGTKAGDSCVKCQTGKHIRTNDTHTHTNVQNRTQIPI